MLSSCHSSKKVYPNDPIYDNGGAKYYDKSNDDYSDTKNISNTRKAIVKEAKRWIGTPYAYSGKSRKGTDCSGMVMTIYENVTGIKLPRNSAKQSEFCTRIDKKNLLPGDLVFFATGKSKNRISHVGIYIGNGNMIHASTSRGVTINNIEEQYYRKTYICSGRVLTGKKNKKHDNDNKKDDETDDFSKQFLE